MTSTSKHSSYFVSNGVGNVELSSGPARPAPGEVLIRTEYAGVNRGDVLGLRGAYGEPTPAGQRVGQDIVGTVEAGGSPTHAHLVGTRVFGQISGAWGEHALAPTSSVIPTLDLPGETAVTLPLPGFTALRLARQAANQAGDLSGQDVLITGGTGAVGSILAQLLTTSGAQVWILTRRPDAPTPPGARTVTSLDDAPTVTVAFESVGGPFLQSALRKLTPHGHLWWFGEASRQAASIDFFTHLARSPWHLHHFAHWIHDGNDADDLVELLGLVTSGALTAPKPRIINPADLPHTIDAIANDTLHAKIAIRF